MCHLVIPHKSNWKFCSSTFEETVVSKVKGKGFIFCGQVVAMGSAFCGLGVALSSVLGCVTLVNTFPEK